MLHKDIRWKWKMKEILKDMEKKNEKPIKICVKIKTLF